MAGSSTLGEASQRIRAAGSRLILRHSLLRPLAHPLRRQHSAQSAAKRRPSSALGAPGTLKSRQSLLLATRAMILRLAGVAFVLSCHPADAQSASSGKSSVWSTVTQSPSCAPAGRWLCGSNESGPRRRARTSGRPREAVHSGAHFWQRGSRRGEECGSLWTPRRQGVWWREM
jgi:hypothetical protein